MRLARQRHLGWGQARHSMASPQSRLAAAILGPTSRLVKCRNQIALMSTSEIYDIQLLTVRQHNRWTWVSAAVLIRPMLLIQVLSSIRRA